MSFSSSMRSHASSTTFDIVTIPKSLQQQAAPDLTVQRCGAAQVGSILIEQAKVDAIFQDRHGAWHHRQPRQFLLPHKRIIKCSQGSNVATLQGVCFKPPTQRRVIT